jgi:hypothetical protein
VLFHLGFIQNTATVRTVILSFSKIFLWDDQVLVLEWFDNMPSTGQCNPIQRSTAAVHQPATGPTRTQGTLFQPSLYHPCNNKQQNTAANLKTKTQLCGKSFFPAAADCSLTTQQIAHHNTCPCIISHHQ